MWDFLGFLHESASSTIASKVSLESETFRDACLAPGLPLVGLRIAQPTHLPQWFGL